MVRRLHRLVAEVLLACSTHSTVEVRAQCTQIQNSCAHFALMLVIHITVHIWHCMVLKMQQLIPVQLAKSEAVKTVLQGII